MTFRIPTDGRRLAQTNESDVTGNIFATRNITLDEKGYIKLSHGTVNMYTKDGDADFDEIQSMFHGNRVYLLGDDLFSFSTLSIDNITAYVNNDTTSDTTPPSPGPEEDGAFFNGQEVVSDGTQLYRQGSANTWTTFASPTLNASYPTVIEPFVSQNSLLVGNANVVYRYNTSWAVAQTLTLPADFTVQSIAVNGNYAYIGTRHTGNGEAVMFLWTGINATNDGAYGVGTFGISSVKAYGSSVVLINATGQLLRFNGAGFDPLAAFPVYYSGDDWADANNDYANLSNRSMVVDGDTILITIDPEITGLGKGYIPNMPGGVWCYDPEVGLYHKFSATNTVILKDTSVDTADIDATTNIITVSGITVPQTGSLVFYGTSPAQIGGLIMERWYYVIKLSDTTLKLAETYADAIAGTAIDITSATTANKFYFISQKDYGVVGTNNRSSILVLNNTEYDANTVGRVIFSNNIEDATGTVKTGLNVTCPLVPNRGYFITPKMFASANLDTFNSITLRFRPLKATDKIIVKYRDKDRLNFPVVPRGLGGATSKATWTSTTVFTTLSSGHATTPLDLSTVEVGDEVEILSGSGAGHIAHVSAISKSGYQYTVTLDEAAPFVTASDVMWFIINNWTKVETIDSTFEGTQKTISIDTQSGWCQFKVELRGIEVAIEDSVVDNTPHSYPRGYKSVT